MNNRMQCMPRSTMVMAIVVALLSLATTQVVGQDLIMCSPTAFTFTLDFSGECPGTIESSPGIEGTDCNIIANSTQDGIPVSVRLIQVLELGASLNALGVQNFQGSYTNGESIEYSSLVNGNITDPENVVSGLQINVQGVNGGGDPITNSFLIEYTNDGTFTPIFEKGDQIGWVVFSDFADARPEYCPAITRAPTTAAPVAPVTAAPVTTAPVTGVPVTTAPVTAAPVTTAPVTVAPVTTAPVTTAPVISPVEPTVAPIAPTVPSDAPIAPTDAPVESSTPNVAPVSTAPVSAAPVVAPVVVPSGSPVVPSSDAPVTSPVVETEAPTEPENPPSDAPISPIAPVSPIAPISPIAPTSAPSTAPAFMPLAPIAPISLAPFEMPFLPTDMSMSMPMVVPTGKKQKKQKSKKSYKEKNLGGDDDDDDDSSSSASGKKGGGKKIKKSKSSKSTKDKEEDNEGKKRKKQKSEKGVDFKDIDGKKAQRSRPVQSGNKIKLGSDPENAGSLHKEDDVEPDNGKGKKERRRLNL